MNKRLVGAGGTVAAGLLMGVAYLGGGSEVERTSLLPATPSVTVDTRVVGTAEHVVEPELPDVSLEGIFDESMYVGTSSGVEVTTVLFGGDVMLGRSVNAFATERGFDWPYREIKTVLAGADLTVVNLESPFAEPCPVTHDGMVFCGNTAHAQSLAASGVDLVNLANNHIYNHGVDGLKTTVATLNDAGIEAYGRDGPVYREINGTRFAFLGYNDVGFTPTEVTQLTEENLQRDVTEARQSADVVVVTPHWGVEYVIEPTERQRKFARLAIDSGADLVVGHHPHWVQVMELYRGKLIAYSLGNLVFDQMWSEETRQGILLKTAFYQEQLVDVELVPVKIFEYGQPRLMRGAARDRLVDELFMFSKEFSGEVE